MKRPKGANNVIDDNNYIDNDDEKLNNLLQDFKNTTTIDISGFHLREFISMCTNEDLVRS